MISIVIPVYNQPDMTKDCIAAVRDTLTLKHEIIVIDNGSDKKFPWHECAIFPTLDKYIRNDSNLGYPVAINQGIRASSGRTIVLLNNDVVVTPKSIERLCTLVDGGHCDIAGPLTNYSAGIQQIFAPAYDNIQELYQAAESIYQDHCGKVTFVNWIIGFCMAFHKSLWEELGPFDESLWPSSGEEIMFCLEARRRDYKICIAEDAYVHHHGSATFTTMADAEIINYEDVCKRNDVYIESKYGTFWSKQLTERDG